MRKPRRGVASVDVVAVDGALCIVHVRKCPLTEVRFIFTNLFLLQALFNDSCIAPAK